MQHRRLAGAVRADQAERLALGDLEIEAVQDLHLAVAGAQALDADEGAAAGERREAPLGDPGAGQGGGLAVDVLDGDHRLDAALAGRSEEPTPDLQSLMRISD